MQVSQIYCWLNTVVLILRIALKVRKCFRLLGDQSKRETYLKDW